MAESKKYYWLKLMKDFFNQPKIKKLRKIAGGDTYTVIYLKMQLLSIDNDAVLEYQGIESNFIEEIALTIDEDIENVTVTINYLITQGLLQEIDESHYILTETQKLIGGESAVAERVRKHRENKKMLLCNTNETKCNTEIEKEKEIEIEKKKETYKDIINAYTSNADLVEALSVYVEMRKSMKGYTKNALKMALNKLDNLACDEETKISIVNQSIENSWKSLYPLKKEDKQKHDDSIDNPLKNERRAF